MRKSFLLTILLIAFVCIAKSQVSMVIQAPPAGVVQKNQLWNLSLMNASSTSFNLTIELTLLSVDIPVMKATSKPIILSQGIRQIREVDIAPVNYNYLSSSFAMSQNSNNAFLPIGNYQACYLVSYYVGENKVVLAEDCIPIEVQPLQPPLLNTPFNGENLQVSYPQFTWLPPAPLSSFDNVKYNLIVTEVYANESPEQSIQNHVPVYNANSLTSLFNMYPSSFKALDTGKLYAWRIVAFNNNQFAAQSDVWTFRITKKITTLSNEGGVYIKLTREIAPFATVKGTVRVEYVNDANDKAINYVIKRLNDGTTVKYGKLVVKDGQNFIDLQLSDDTAIEDRHTYLLQVINSRNEVWTIKFLYQKPEITSGN